MKDNEIRATGSMPVLDWLLTISRSKYRKRIEMKILKLKLALSDVQREKKEHEKLRQIQKICACWVKEQEIENDIKLLKELLTK